MLGKNVAVIVSCYAIHGHYFFFRGQMPTVRAGRFGLSMRVKSAINFAGVLFAVVAVSAQHFVIQIFCKPSLCADLNGFINLRISRIGKQFIRFIGIEIVPIFLWTAARRFFARTGFAWRWFVWRRDLVNPIFFGTFITILHGDFISGKSIATVPNSANPFASAIQVVSLDSGRRNRIFCGTALSVFAVQTLNRIANENRVNGVNGIGVIDC